MIFDFGMRNFVDVNEAKDIVNVLRAGELPVSLEIIEARNFRVEN